MLSVEITFEILIEGNFCEDNLLIKWKSNRTRINEELKYLIDSYWERLMESKGDRMLYNGSLCKLMNFKRSGDILKIKFGLTDYKELVFSNVHHNYIIQRYGKESLSNGTAVCTSIISNDEKQIIQIRSDKVFENPGYYHVCGGNIDPTIHLKNKIPDPFFAIKSELKEELNISDEDITLINCLGLIRNKETYKPELVFETFIQLDFKQILCCADQTDSSEYSEIIGILDDKEILGNFLISVEDRISPPGYAALWLHGKEKNFW